jgi:iron complex transport system ATP-binding protein
MSRPVVELAGVVRRAGGRRIVDGVSLALPPGRVVAVVGPNGAGKSSLVGLASGHVAPAEGRVLYDGTPVAAWAPWRLAAKRAVMAQTGGTAFSFTVADLAAIGAAGVGRGLDAGARAALVATALETADVAHLADRDVTTLSGGERQRARFAQALAQLAAGRSVEERQVLLLDEPVASLDLRHQIFLLDAARARADAGVSVLVVLHDLRLARAYADEVVVMSAGRIAAAGPPDAVITAPLVERVFGLAPAASRGVLDWLAADA